MMDETERPMVRLYDFDPVRVKKKMKDRPYGMRAVGRTSVSHGVTTAETVCDPVSIIAPEILRTGSRLPYAYADVHGESWDTAEAALVDGERISAILVRQTFLIPPVTLADARNARPISTRPTYPSCLSSADVKYASVSSVAKVASRPSGTPGDFPQMMRECLLCVLMVRD